MLVWFREWSRVLTPIVRQRGEIAPVSTNDVLKEYWYRPSLLSLKCGKFIQG